MALMPRAALAAFFRYPPVTTWHRHPHDSAPARAHRCGHDDDLYPCPAAGWPGRAESLGRSRRVIGLLSCLVTGGLLVTQLPPLPGLGGQHPLCLCGEGLPPGCRGLPPAHGRRGRLHPRHQRRQRRRLGGKEGLPLRREITASHSRLHPKRRGLPAGYSDRVLSPFLGQSFPAPPGVPCAATLLVLLLGKYRVLWLRRATRREYVVPEMRRAFDA